LSEVAAKWLTRLVFILEVPVSSLDMIYLLTAVGLSPDGSSTVHIYTQTIHGPTQIKTEQHK